MLFIEQLQKDLNDYATYLAISIKRDYGMFFNQEKIVKINKIINDENLVVFDNLVGKNKIHISPNHEIFKTKDYKTIKEYFENNLLLEEILRFFLTFSISEEEYKSLKNANAEQSLQLFLKNGFVYYIAREFSLRSHLKFIDRYQINVEFVEALLKEFGSLSSLKSMAFSKEYLFFKAKFYEQTGKDLLDFYLDFLESRGHEEIEILNPDEYIDIRGCSL